MSFTRTKIICTIGPATETISALKKLHNNGMNVARINMSHATHKSAKAVIDRKKKSTMMQKLNLERLESC
jgi:pyruvate kinase